ncbi:hypothetical protein JCGZ_25524 [Jatropha curcas]|uniref:Transcription termination factor MTEF18, mitochondrial-like n=2 Tax=Jatropha curcas TaxID=180498 RepID=A0A067JP45_JATCU|nr:hypothetical protein JCGZ_25524 [Jatropha curcas]
MASILCIAKNYRFYGRKRIVLTENSDNLDKNLLDNSHCFGNISRATRKRAQAALLEYLHLTRSIPFTDAENMSVNSPHFLGKLLQKVDIETDIGESVARFLRYHPINEFEPFFESLGLKPYEYIPLLPRDMMFLSDDELLLDNYYVLCNYGIPRNKIGRIYKEATEIFRYDYGVLAFKLQAYEQLGISQSFTGRVVACSPYLLIGDVNVEFMKVLNMLRKGRLEFSWIEEHLSENSYNWSRMLSILNLFRCSGYSEEQLHSLISRHPMILFEGSGDKTLCLIVFLFKFGYSMNQICSIFPQFSNMQVGEFVSNLRKCFLFLTEIQMEENEIGKIVRSYPLLLGSCTLKRANTVVVTLNVGKRRLCKIIQDNPQEMKKWVIGSKIERLSNIGEQLKSKMLKAKFLLDVGLVDNPSKLENALKVVRGRGTELQERFDCIMRAGLDRKDVCRMVKVSPQILNQKKEVLEEKIDFLVNGLGYPISEMIRFPEYLNYTTQRVKLRLEMYKWLKAQGTGPLLSMSTVIACTEDYFVRQHVERHPQGLKVWQKLKEKNSLY